MHLHTNDSIVQCLWSPFHFESQINLYCRRIPTVPHLIDLKLHEQTLSASFCLVLYASVASTAQEERVNVSTPGGYWAPFHGQGSVLAVGISSNCFAEDEVVWLPLNSLISVGVELHPVY